MNELRAAALKYAQEENDRHGRIPGHDGETLEAFMAGAAWQRQQILKDLPNGGYESSDGSARLGSTICSHGAPTGTNCEWCNVAANDTSAKPVAETEESRHAQDDSTHDCPDQQITPVEQCLVCMKERYEERQAPAQDGCRFCVTICDKCPLFKDKDICPKCGISRLGVGHDLSKTPYECHNKPYSYEEHAAVVNAVCAQTQNAHATGCNRLNYLNGTQAWGCVPECPTRQVRTQQDAKGD